MNKIKLIPRYDFDTNLLAEVSIQFVNFNKKRGSKIYISDPIPELDQKLDQFVFGWHWFKTDDHIAYCCNPTSEEILESLFISTTYNGHGFYDLDLWVGHKFHLHPVGERILIKKLNILIQEDISFFTYYLTS